MSKRIEEMKASEAMESICNTTERARRSDSLYYDTQVTNRRALCDMIANLESVLAESKAENAKLREQLERVQPTDCEGNALDIADTVHMLRSEYDGDHEWEDVVTELVLTKWGGDRWIVRGSKGEAWACDCTKTGYDEDAYEASDDVEPFDEPTLLEVENDKLRELLRDTLTTISWCTIDCCPSDSKKRELNARACELGIELNDCE